MQKKIGIISVGNFSSDRDLAIGRSISSLLLGLLVILATVSGCTEDIRTEDRVGQQDQGVIERVGQAMPASTQQATSPNLPQNQGERQLITAIQEVAEAVRPAVVFISVRAVTAGEFLQPVPQQGVGSGVIYDPSGLILTNNHV
ncbi:MAG: serine protease, partial [Chloroflexi bacterium]|nr:serine protease [Chloroflexota bacterium]